jgi:hypothetical protein
MDPNSKSRCGTAKMAPNMISLKRLLLEHARHSGSFYRIFKPTTFTVAVLKTLRFGSAFSKSLKTDQNPHQVNTIMSILFHNTQLSSK